MVKNTFPDYRAIFIAYIEAINTHEPHTNLDLSSYMHSNLTVNNLHYSLSEYEASLLALMNSAPDFHIRIQLLIVERTMVATRFLVTCTPRSYFMGYPPNGNRIEYAEHVFYHFDGGKCCEINALIDRESIRRQLGEELPMS